MQLQSLSHLLSVIHAVARPQKIYLFGSACLLPEHPELGEPGQPLALTQDGDFLIEPVDDSMAGVLQEALGTLELCGVATIRINEQLRIRDVPGHIE